MRNFSDHTDYGNRKMFLDPSGPVTIQRYDNYRYERQAEYLRTARGAFWIPDEITMTQDRIDHSRVKEETSRAFTWNLLRQTALDSEQGRMPVQVFTPVCSIPEAEAWMLWWSAFEQIHSESYSHIIRNVYQMPADEFRKIHDTPEIVAMLCDIDKYYERLHAINSRVVVLNDFKARGVLTPDLEKTLAVSEYEHIKAIYFALYASYGLEAIRFMVSFATSLAMAENKIYVGSGNIIKQIMFDEGIHTAQNAWMIQVNLRDDARFAQVHAECKREAADMLLAIVDEEKAWAKFQLRENGIPGINLPVMLQQIDYTAQQRFPLVGIEYSSRIDNPPLPWFAKQFNTNNTQNALQENEGSEYVLNPYSGEIDYAALPKLKMRIA